MRFALLYKKGTKNVKRTRNMLHFKGKATFKCKQCGHKFEAFDTEGGIRYGPNLPCCPKCGSSETRKITFLE